jgi:hypothetical protein
MTLSLQACQGQVLSSMAWMVIWFMLAFVDAQTWSPTTLPLPGTSPSECGIPAGFRALVCDPDVHMTVREKDMLAQYMLHEKSLIRPAIVLIDKMDPAYIASFPNKNSNFATRQFTRAVFGKWGLHGGMTANGAVIFVSLQDRSVFIATGSWWHYCAHPAVSVCHVFMCVRVCMYFVFVSDVEWNTMEC